jgi:hypothetical protein
MDSSRYNILPYSEKLLKTKNVLFIDTNVLYFLIKYSDYKEINKKAFINYVHRFNDDFAISSYTVFEIINNKHLMEESGGKIQNVLNRFPACYYIIEANDTEKSSEGLPLIERLFGDDYFDEQFCKYKLGKEICVKFATDSSFLIALCLLPYIELFYFLPDDCFIDRIWREKYETRSKQILEELKQFYCDKLYATSLKILEEDCFSEKNLSFFLPRILSNLFFSYIPIFNQTVNELNNNRLSWKKLYFRNEKWWRHLNKDLLLETKSADTDFFNVYKTSHKMNSNLISKKNIIEGVSKGSSKENTFLKRIQSSIST